MARFKKLLHNYHHHRLNANVPQKLHRPRVRFNLSPFKENTHIFHTLYVYEIRCEIATVNTTFRTCMPFSVSLSSSGLSNVNLPNEKVALTCHRGPFNEYIWAPDRAAWLCVRLNLPDCSDAVKKLHNLPSS